MTCRTRCVWGTGGGGDGPPVEVRSGPAVRRARSRGSRGTWTTGRTGPSVSRNSSRRCPTGTPSSCRTTGRRRTVSRASGGTAGRGGRGRRRLAPGTTSSASSDTTGTTGGRTGPTTTTPSSALGVESLRRPDRHRTPPCPPGAVGTTVVRGSPCARPSPLLDPCLSRNPKGLGASPKASCLSDLD